MCARSQESFVNASTWGTCRITCSTTTDVEFVYLLQMPEFKGGGKAYHMAGEIVAPRKPIQQVQCTHSCRTTESNSGHWCTSARSHYPIKSVMDPGLVVIRYHTKYIEAIQKSLAKIEI